MKWLLPLVAFCLQACGSPNQQSSTGQLLENAVGPGVPTSEYAAVGVPFYLNVYTLSLPNGNCGLSVCPPAAEHLTITSASCADGACDATVKSHPGYGGASLYVTPKKAGAASIHIEAQGQSSGEKYSDTYAMTFVASAHLEIRATDHPLLDRSKYPSIPGTKCHWQVTLEDDSANELAGARELFSAAVDGSSFSLDGSVSNDTDITVTSLTPGSGTLHLALGPVKRDIPMSVVDSTQVTSVEFHDLTLPANLDSTKFGGPDVVGAKVDTLVADTKAPLGTSWAVVLKTAGGGVALGGASSLTVSPSAAAENRSKSGYFDDGLLALDHFQPQTASVTGTIGAVNVSIPLQFQ